MWKVPASVICGCLTALPLIGCAGDATIARHTTPDTPLAIADTALYYSAASRVYAAAPAVPAAVLVFLPAPGSGDILARDPALWAAQGFEVVMPQPDDIYRLVADQQGAWAHLLASAHALADAPVWLVGPSLGIDAAFAAAPQLGRGEVSGVVVTSVTSNFSNCSASVFYSDPGTGAPPKIDVRKSGDCEPASPPSPGRQPSVLPAPPAAPPIIEASALPKGLPTAAQVRRLAELIKAPPAS